MKSMLIIVSLIAVAVAGPHHRLAAPDMTGPEGIVPIAPGQTGPEGIETGPIAPGQTGPEGIEGIAPVAPGPAGPTPIEELIPIVIGPAVIDEFAPADPGSMGPAVIDLTPISPENVITIPGPDGTPLVQIVVNINAPVAEETSPVGVVAPALPWPVNVVDNVVGPDSASLGVPTAPEVEVNPAIVMPELLN